MLDARGLAMGMGLLRLLPCSHGPGGVPWGWGLWGWWWGCECVAWAWMWVGEVGCVCGGLGARRLKSRGLLYYTSPLASRGTRHGSHTLSVSRGVAGASHYPG